MSNPSPRVPMFPSGRDADEKGVSLREMVAAMALQAVIMSHDKGTNIKPDAAAKRAVEFADALVARLAAAEG